MSTTKKRPLAIIRANTIRGIGNLVFRVNGIVSDMGKNTGTFPTPVPALSAVTTDVNTLIAAQSLTKTRASGAIAARDIAANTVNTDLLDLMVYVQTKADAAVDAAASILVIQTAGFGVKVNGRHLKPPLEAISEVKQVKLVAKSVKFAKAYNWDMSADKGVTWVNLTTTTKANYLVTGLNTGDSLQFRVRAILPAAPAPWSNAVSAVVQ